MRLTNSTQWDTRQLRSFCLAGLKAKGANPRRYRIEIKQSKAYRGTHLEGENREWVGSCGYALHGLGGVGYEYVALFLPRLDFSLRKLAQIFEHEIDHTLGLRHKDMADSKTLPVPWIEGLAIEKKAPAEKKQRDVIAERIRKAEANAKKYRTKLKRTQTALKKWERQIRYYQTKYPDRFES